MYKEQKTNVKFKDGKNILYNVEIKITHRNGYPEFSMSGEGQGSMGQCYDDIKPKNPKQKRLIEIWKTYHLNGTKAGNEAQTKKLEEMPKPYDYDKALKFLNGFKQNGEPISAIELQEIEEKRKMLEYNIDKVKTKLETIKDLKTEKLKNFQMGGMYIVLKDLEMEKKFFNTRLKLKYFFERLEKKENILLDKLKSELEQEQEKTLLYGRGKDGILYQYGATWHRVDLPKNLWEEVEQLVKDIREIEEKSRVKGGSWEELHEYKKVALGKYLDLEPKEAEEDITEEYDGVYSYCGVEYYVLTEDEAQDKAEDYLGDELWQMAVESGNTKMGKQEWIEWVISQDGYGQTLNHYDGTEHFDEENQVYIMRV